MFKNVRLAQQEVESCFMLPLDRPEQLLDAGSDSFVQNTEKQEERGPIEFNQALSYVNKIKNRFSDRPELYKVFLEILEGRQLRSAPISEIYPEIVELLRSEPDLTDEFKLFMPESTRLYSDTSIKCVICHDNYEMDRLNPPLLKKTSRGFAWVCAPCSTAQEKRLETLREDDDALNEQFEALQKEKMMQAVQDVDHLNKGSQSRSTGDASTTHIVPGTPIKYHKQAVSEDLENRKRKRGDD